MTYLKLCFSFITILVTTIGYLYWKLMNLKVKKTERTGGHIIAEALHSLGVKQAFTLVGGHISSILVECDKLGIKIIDVRDEASKALLRCRMFNRFTWCGYGNSWSRSD